MLLQNSTQSHSIEFEIGCCLPLKICEDQLMSFGWNQIFEKVVGDSKTDSKNEYKFRRKLNFNNHIN